MRNKKVLLIAFISLVVILIGGVSFAFFNYYKESRIADIVAGTIYLRLNEGQDSISITNALPEKKEKARRRNDNILTFSVEGKNTSNQDILYSIELNNGTDSDDPNKERFNEEHLVFDLVEIDGNDRIMLVDAKSFSEFNHTKIWDEIVRKNTEEEISHTYELRMWLSEDVTFGYGENVDYTSEEFKNRYASIKIAISGETTSQEYQKVTFNADGGEVVPPYKYVLIGEEYGELPTPTKAGYRFVGWNGKNLANYEDKVPDNDGYYTGMPNINAAFKTNTRYTMTVNGYAVGNDYDSDTTIWINYIYTDGVFNFGDATPFYKAGIIRKINVSKASNTVLRIETRANHGENNIKYNYFQLEEGVVATLYEPYYVTSNIEVTEWNTPMVLTAKWESTQIELSKETYIEEDLTTWTASGVTFNNGVATLNNTSSTLTSGYIPVSGEFWYITFDAYTENVVSGKDYGAFLADTSFYDSNYNSTKSIGNITSNGAANRLTLNEWNIDKMYSNTIEEVKNRQLYGPNVRYVKIKFHYNSSYSSIPYSLRNAKIHGQMPNSFYLINIDVSDENDVSLLKYAKGEHDVAYFKRNGQQVSGTQIRVTENEVYTVYAKYEDGYEGVYTIEITNIIE